MWCKINQSMVEYSAGTIDLRWHEGLRVSHCLSGSLLAEYSLDPWNPAEKKYSWSHTPKLCLGHAQIHIIQPWIEAHLHIGSMTSLSIEGIGYTILRNPTRTISSLKVSRTSDIKYIFGVYNHSTSFISICVSPVATVIAFHSCSWLNIIFRLSIHIALNDHYWSKYRTSVAVFNHNWVGTQLARYSLTDCIEMMYIQFQLLAGLSILITLTATMTKCMVYWGDCCSTQWNRTSAKCKSAWKPHAILPDTPGDRTSASKYF